MRGLFILVLCVAIAAVSARPVERYDDVEAQLVPSLELTAEDALASPLESFQLWSSHYGKKYKNKAERSTRLEIFKSNAAWIKAQNAAQSTATFALNTFADLTFEEFSATHLGLLPGAGASDRLPTATFSHSNVTELPASIDWRKKGAVTGVKNQGSCGSCWAFSTTGAIEGINAIKTGKLVSLSEQQLVSCDTEKDNGCGGGLMDFAFDYVTKNGGLDTEEDYPYWGFGMPCQSAKAKDRTVVTIDGFEDVPKSDASALRKAISQQPVSVAICASMSLQLYSKGIVTDDQCCQGLNHGVLAVGYDDESWIIKNSWGAGWGDAGSFRLSSTSAHAEGACGVLSAASYPIKTHDNPAGVPSFCGYFSLVECPASTTCQCTFELFGFCWPWSWGCQRDASGGEP